MDKDALLARLEAVIRELNGCTNPVARAKLEQEYAELGAQLNDLEEDY